MRSPSSSLETLWRGRVAAWRATGLPAVRFAPSQGYSTSTLLRWAHRLKDRPQPRGAEGPAFVPVVRASAPELLVEVGGARVRVTHGFDPELLASVVRAIGGAT